MFAKEFSSFLTWINGVPMGTVAKILAAGLFAGIFLLIARFADEYFRPYKRKN